jgi:hypothetical protein
MNRARPLTPLLHFGAMELKRIRGRHQYRLVLCGHKAVEAGAVCLVLMVQGQLMDATLSHLLIAAKTGVLAMSPALGVTFTRYAHHFANKWVTALFFGISTFAADSAIHPSHYPGEYSEAAFTAVGAFALSLVVASTPLGKRIDALAEAVFHRPPASRDQQPDLQVSQQVRSASIAAQHTEDVS